MDGGDAAAVARRLRSRLQREAACRAARVGDILLQPALDKIGPGTTEFEVYAEIVYAVARARGARARSGLRWDVRSKLLPARSAGLSALIDTMMFEERGAGFLQAFPVGCSSWTEGLGWL